MWLQLQKLLLVLIWSCRGYLDEKPRTRPILAFPWVFLTMVVYAGFPCSIVQLYNNIARCNLIDTKYRQMVFRSPSDGAPISPIQRWFRDFYSQFECRPSLNYSTFLKSWCAIICQSCIMLLRVQLGHRCSINLPYRYWFFKSPFKNLNLWFWAWKPGPS